MAVSEPHFARSLGLLTARRPAAGHGAVRPVTRAIRNIFAMTPLPLELDYVSAPRRLPWPGLAVLAVALVTAVALAWHYRDVQGKLAFLQASLGLQGAARPPRQENTARLESEERQLGLVVRQLTLPWAQMVDAL